VGDHRVGDRPVCLDRLDRFAAELWRFGPGASEHLTAVAPAALSIGDRHLSLSPTELMGWESHTPCRRRATGGSDRASATRPPEKSRRPLGTPGFNQPSRLERDLQTERLHRVRRVSPGPARLQAAQAGPAALDLANPEPRPGLRGEGHHRGMCVLHRVSTATLPANGASETFKMSYPTMG
jgi:hypothetical protein